jgi:hypothetical protein
MQAARSAGRAYDRHHPSDSSGFGPVAIIISFAGAIGFPVMIHSALGDPSGSGFALFVVGLIGSLVCVPVACFMLLAGLFLGGASLLSSGDGRAEPDTLTSLNLQSKYHTKEELSPYRSNRVMKLPHR